MIGRPSAGVVCLPLCAGPSGVPQPPVYLALAAIHAVQVWPAGEGAVRLVLNPGQAAPAHEHLARAADVAALVEAWVARHDG
jgi:hypothetical protein